MILIGLKENNFYSNLQTLEMIKIELLQKSDGSWTYFASDVAYHKNKIDRKYDYLDKYFRC
jgi:arginyl-tRNA synthetase